MSRLPFRPEFEEAIRSGEKTATTRTRRYGKVGDVLGTPFGPIRLTAVYRVTLGSVRDRYWQEEGVASPEDFERVWAEIHPRAGFRKDLPVVLHRFEYVGAGITHSQEQKG